jgi:hypothetical protein
VRWRARFSGVIVAPNGKEFVLVKGAGDAQAFVIHDWRAQLRARASTQK